MKSPSALDKLGRAAADGMSGEFICATGAAEVHVVLQRGRVVWASDSAHPFEFARFVSDVCQVDEESFRHVLDECQRHGQPVGETLVRWKLATPDEVLAALGLQLALALGVMDGGEPASTLFLDRTRMAFDERLTFALEPLLPAARAVRRDAHVPGRATTAAQLFEAVPGASWAALTQRGETQADVAPVSCTWRRPAAIAAASLDDGADFVGLRAPGFCLLGARTPTGEESWLGLGADAPFGQALRALGALNADPAWGPPPSRASGGSGRWARGRFAGEAARAVDQVLDAGREVLAVFVTDPSGALEAAVGRESLEPADCEAIACRRAALVAAAQGFEEPPDGAVPAFALTASGLRTVCTREPALWSCAGEISRTDRLLWVATTRAAPPALGAACLTSLVRILAEEWGLAAWAPDAPPLSPRPSGRAR